MVYLLAALLIPLAATSDLRSNACGRTNRTSVQVSGNVRLKSLLQYPARSSDNAPDTFPCALLIGGSGSVGMDSCLNTIPPVSVLRDVADYLSQHGVATLRYNKRTYNHERTTFDALIHDAATMLHYLHASGKCAANEPITIIGHSQGANIALVLGSGADGTEAKRVNATLLVDLPRINVISFMGEGISIEHTMIRQLVELGEPEDAALTRQGFAGLRDGTIDPTKDMGEYEQGGLSGRFLLQWEAGVSLLVKQALNRHGDFADVVLLLLFLFFSISFLFFCSSLSFFFLQRPTRLTFDSICNGSCRDAVASWPSTVRQTGKWRLPTTTRCTTRSQRRSAWEVL